MLLLSSEAVVRHMTCLGPEGISRGILEQYVIWSAEYIGSKSSHPPVKMSAFCDVKKKQKPLN